MPLEAVQAGPAWSVAAMSLARAPRYPLRAETHVQQMVDALVPGVITVTPHARYLTLHGLCWEQAANQGLDLEGSLDLLRRAEVVMAGIAARHELSGGHDLAIGAAHGGDVVGPLVQSDSGELAIAELAAVGRYSQARWGFGGTYLGSELRLGVVSNAPHPRPGPRFDSAAANAALGHVLELARSDRVSIGILSADSDSCVCRAPASPDGHWLQQLLGDPRPVPGFERPDRARRETIRLAAAAVRHAQISGSLEPGFARAVAFGPLLREAPELAGLQSAEAWRGVALRNLSVSAWRRLWAWLVEQLAEPMTRQQLADRLADSMPTGSVAEHLLKLPPLIQGHDLLPVELDVRTSAGLKPLEELRVLAIGAARLAHLDGTTRDAFAGGEDAVLGPRWLHHRIEASADRSLRAFAGALGVELVDRAKRVAMSKASINRDGTFWYPSRVVERDGVLFRRSNEGSGDVGLRINTLGQVLLSAGAFERNEDGTWRVATNSGANV